MGIIYFILGLGFLIAMHELGHMVVAKKCGISVETFSIGFGPRLFSFKWGETQYQLALIPLGGYVKFLGDESGKEYTTDPRSFFGSPVWQRFIVALAGPAMNILLALIIMPLVFMGGHVESKTLAGSPIIENIIVDSPAARFGLKVGDEIISFDGKPYESWKDLINQIALSAEREVSISLKRGSQVIDKEISISSNPATQVGYLGVEPIYFMGNSPIIDKISPNSPAEMAGIQVGDRIVSIDGVDISTWVEMAEIISASEGRSLQVTAQRWENDKGLVAHLVLSPKFDPSLERWIAGIQKDTNNLGSEIIQKEYTFFGAIVRGFEEVQAQTILTFNVIGKLVTGNLSIKALAGPVRIAEAAVASAKTGFSNYLYFIAFLSLQLGILNLLPIPALDGGHIVYLFFEKIFSKPVPIRIRSVIDTVGISLLLLLMLFVTFNDVTSMWNIGALVDKITGLF